MIEKTNLKRALVKIGIKHIKFLLLRDDEAIIYLSELNEQSTSEIANLQKVQTVAKLLKFKKRDYQWLDQIIAKYQRRVNVIEVAEKMIDWLEEHNIKDGNLKLRYRRFLKNAVQWRADRIKNRFENNIDDELLRKLND